MTHQEFIDQYPEAQQWIEAKAAGLPGSYESFKQYRQSLPNMPYEGSPQAALDYAYESRITDDFSY